jgi:integrase
VFLDETRDRRLSIAYFWSEWRDKAGSPGIMLHDRRHSFAGHTASISEMLPMFGKLLGHAKIASRTRYA